jgi:iron complex transport system substrate-binding protein
MHHLAPSIPSGSAPQAAPVADTPPGWSSRSTAPAVASGPGSVRRLRALASAALLLVACAALLPAASAAAPAEGAAPDGSVVDDLGRAVLLERPARRVVSMAPSHTEAVCALERCHLLVGRDAASNHPEQVLALPDLGSAFAPDLERLVALEPDLVLVDEYSGLAEALAPLGIPVYAGTPQRLEEIFVLFERLGRLLDAEREAVALGDRVRGDIDAIAARVAGLPAPRVYYEIDATPYSVGPDGFIGTLIALAGGANIVPADLGEFPLLDPEFVVAGDPEVIVLANAPYGESLATVRARPGWSGLSAVVTGRVAELDAEEGDLLSRAGPRVGEAVALLARLFHPGAF